MSMRLMVKVLEVKVGNPSRKLVLLKLADNANDNGECWPSYRHIAEHCDMSRRSVVTHIKKLEQQGFITKRRRTTSTGSTSNVYTITLDNGDRQHQQEATKSDRASTQKPPKKNTTQGDEGVKILHPPSENLAPPSENLSPPPSENFSPRTSQLLEPPKEPLSTPLPPQDEAERESVSNAIASVFAYWQSVMNHPRAKLDSKRRTAIRSALNHYTTDELKTAIDGCALSPYHCGDNPRRQKYDSIGLIFRSADHIERFMEFTKSPPKVDKNSGGMSLAERNAQNAREAAEMLFGRQDNMGSAENASDVECGAITGQLI